MALRNRWPDDLDPKLRKWLTRVQCVQAHLRSTLLIYCRIRNVEGMSDYARRVARGDRTILYDALTRAIDEFHDVREEIQQVMDSATPTKAMPGTHEKVIVMEERAKSGFSIFIASDAKPS